MKPRVPYSEAIAGRLLASRGNTPRAAKILQRTWSRAPHPDLATAYAYARTGYHRGLDALRRAGWKGRGPVPWAHVPNRGYLRSVRALAAAAEHVGETDEVTRLGDLLRDGDPTLG